MVCPCFQGQKLIVELPLNGAYDLVVCMSCVPNNLSCKSVRPLKSSRAIEGNAVTSMQQNIKLNHKEAQ